MDNPSETDAVVSVTVPARPDLIQVLRSVTAGVAARLDLPFGRALAAAGARGLDGVAGPERPARRGALRTGRRGGRGAHAEAAAGRRRAIVTDAAEDRRAHDLERSAELFDRLPDEAAREELVLLHRPLAEYLARRFSGRGEPQ